jgi:hypothetical protein
LGSGEVQGLGDGNLQLASDWLRYGLAKRLQRIDVGLDGVFDVDLDLLDGLS